MEKFREMVKANNAKYGFVYREWMWEAHLLVVHKIAMELCGIYPEADRELVEALVWFHDFGKPIDEENEREVTRTEGPKTMRECGFGEDFVSKVLRYWELMEQKNEIDIRTCPIEVQIISSADGCSHLVGVFYASWFRDYAGQPLVEIQKMVKEKMEKDWNRKIVLPEARQAFDQRYLHAKELFGEFPKRFI